VKSMKRQNGDGCDSSGAYRFLRAHAHAKPYARPVTPVTPVRGAHMNRHERRVLIAKSRRRTGYVHRLIAAQEAIARAGAGTVSHLFVHHAPECAFHTDRGGCNCVPDMSLHPDGGKAMLVIDEDGATQEVVAS
jgi:hypothetical protein